MSNDQGYHRRLGSKWAYCGQDCPRDSQEMCQAGEIVLSGLTALLL